MTDRETMREKLVELLIKSPLFDGLYGEEYTYAAGYLIANGVTVREWIPAAERMPEGIGIFEVMDATIGVIGFARYDPGKKLFEMLPSQYSNLIHVSHWRYVKVKGYYHKARMRGRWIWKDGKCFCSICSKQGDPKRRYEDGTVEEYDFCPNCGAEVKEDEDDYKGIAGRDPGDGA